MPREEWREGDRLHFKEYRVVGKESHTEEMDKVMEEVGVAPATRKTVLMAIDIFNAKVVSIERDGQGRTKVLWKEGQ